MRQLLNRRMQFEIPKESSLWPVAGLGKGYGMLSVSVGQSNLAIKIAKKFKEKNSYEIYGGATSCLTSGLAFVLFKYTIFSFLFIT